MESTPSSMYSLKEGTGENAEKRIIISDEIESSGITFTNIFF